MRLGPLPTHSDHGRQADKLPPQPCLMATAPNWRRQRVQPANDNQKRPQSVSLETARREPAESVALASNQKNGSASERRTSTVASGERRLWSKVDPCGACDERRNEKLMRATSQSK